MIFLTSEGSYEEQIVDEHEHDLQIKHNQDQNPISKSVVKMEDFYDLKDRFNKITNSKTQSSTLRFEVVNLGSTKKTSKKNLGLGLSSEERLSFIRLLKTYKGVFAWDYADLKTYDTFLIQHTIPMTLNEKPVQQKLRKIHPNLESQVKSELNKLFKAKIIFPIRHSKWVSNMVPIRKKNVDIRICIDFRNLNKACQKIIFLCLLWEKYCNQLQVPN